MKKKQSQCDLCAYYDYNEEDEVYECHLNLDQDEMESFCGRQRNDCPYFRFYDEYSVVRKQN